MEDQYRGFGITMKSSTVYGAGLTAVFMLSVSDCDHHRALQIRARGRLSVERRWMKSNGARHVADVFPGMDARTQECTIFSTNYIAPLKAEPGLDESFFVQVDLPSDLLPSFKGLSLSIHYSLEILFKKSSGEGMERIEFPIVVEGEGFLNKMGVYECREGAISFFSVSHLSEEAMFSRPYQADPSLLFSLVKKTASVLHSQSVDVADKDTSSSPEGLGSHSYNISNEAGLICTLHILRAGFGNYLLPGDDINVRADFLDSTHPCEGIRAKIVQMEIREDNSRIQEKVVSVMAKSTAHAALLNISLPIPADIVPTFDCPIAKLRYHLEFSFFLGGASDEGESFNWNIPITIATRSSVATIGEHDRYTSPLELTHYWPKTDQEILV